ncbi:response regulator Mcs4 [Schizosaccharomyces cryophilus OY26]|uniref:Response regulator Mcs4 n=1 Tax=Schizosaccharomyces cryophilus (strain OY26 / ATCC MYA-4695 / CBS 11777 / NBRC 106824 / NRRL Y48691) TaxID=653667 RepID=S9X9Q9_SCHCR|nr:response regulator Mcs4 [Schizosaccharomyces cryophilus OY26]EPY50501.1 response regulator Mcs4 [Schizosaccharomyces cryophilus OY26]
MRVWFKKLPDGVVSSVLVTEEYLVDDLKDAISQKFPVRIARHFDAPELNIRLVAPSNCSSEPQSRDLEPNENLLLTMNYYFPHGQTIDEALLVSVPSVPYAQSQSDNSLPSSRSNSYEMVANNNTPEFSSTSQISNIIADSGPRSKQPSVSEIPDSPSNHSLHRAPSNSYLYKVPSIANPSNRSLGRGRSNTLVNKPGVLLLPRYSRQQSSSSRSGVSDHASCERTYPAVTANSKQAFSSSTSSGNTVKPEQKKSPEIPQSSADSLYTRPNSSPIQSSLIDEPASSSTQQILPESTVKAGSESKNKPAISPQASYSENTGDSSRNNSPVNVIGTAGISAKTPFASLLEGVIPPIEVLIVEDNIINQKILVAFMKKRNISSEVAKDGLEALEKWKKKSYHLILMDIQLPTLTGIEVTKEIRRLERLNAIGLVAQKPTEPIPEQELLPPDKFQSPVIIVALTASSLMTDRNEALAAGCNDFLTKPVSLVWLEKKITEWGCMQALIDWNRWRRFRGH